jgi:hypothetical protein
VELKQKLGHGRKEQSGQKMADHQTLHYLEKAAIRTQITSIHSSFIFNLNTFIWVPNYSSRYKLSIGIQFAV